MRKILSSLDLQPSGSRRGFRLLFAIVLIAAIQGVVLFLIGTTAAMWAYPDYTFTDNFLSDLGRNRFEQNYIFNYAIIWLGISLIPMFMMIWITDPRQSFSAKVTAVFGIMSACGLIGLGVNPVDDYFFAHHFWLTVWLFPMFYMTVSFFYVASRSPYVGIGFLSASLVMVVCMIAYLLKVELTSFQLLQKAIVVCALIWLAYMIAFIAQSGHRVLKEWEIDDESRRRKEEAFYASLKARSHRMD